MKNIKKYFGLLITIILSVSSQQIQSSLQKYFKSTSQDEFYVSIGVNEEITSFIVNRWRTWQSLYILSNKEDPNNIYLKKSQTSIIFSKLQKQESLVLQVNLGQNCQRYYPKTPKILIITLQKDIIALLQSNNWANGLCQPDLILIEHQNKSKRIEQYLSKTGYVKKSQIKSILSFTLKTKTQIQKQPTQNILPFLPVSKIISNLQQKLGNEPFKFYLLTDQYLILADLFDFSQSKQQNVFVLNFHSATDFIVLAANQTISHIQDKNNNIFYKLQIKQNLSLTQYFILIPFQPKAMLKLMRLQSQSLCQNRQQLIIIESIPQVVNSNQSHLQAPIAQQTQLRKPIQPQIMIETITTKESEQDYLNLVQYILFGVVLFAITYVIIKFTRNLKKDPIKQKYRNIKYLSLSRIQDYSQEDIQIIQYH